jgi:hypothetical protein
MTFPPGMALVGSRSTAVYEQREHAVRGSVKLVAAKGVTCSGPGDRRALEGAIA